MDVRFWGVSRSLWGNIFLRLLWFCVGGVGCWCIVCYGVLYGPVNIKLTVFCFPGDSFVRQYWVHPLYK